MANYSAILSSIANEVAKVLPEAKVSLFGSRATGTATSESDWDILILTQEPVTEN
jgi:predicted nucleotidyltransferase